MFTFTAITSLIYAQGMSILLGQVPQVFLAVGTLMRLSLTQFEEYHYSIQQPPFYCHGMCSIACQKCEETVVAGVGPTPH